jgi:hypothetical protein
MKINKSRSHVRMTGGGKLTEVIAFYMIMVQVLSLNTRGLKGENKQINLSLYARLQRADIILLQVTNLPDFSVLQSVDMYEFKHNPSVQTSSGTSIAFHKSIKQSIVIHTHEILVNGYLQTC